MSSNFIDPKQILKTEDSLYNLACEYLPGGLSRNIIYRKPHPHYVVSASGCYVTDIHGVKRLDCENNIASLIHGHAHPKLLEVVIDQLKRGTAFTLATEVEINYAQLLCERVPSFDQIRFVNSGTEAVMGMIKTARAYTGKSKIAKAEGAYHGSYDYAEVSQNASPLTWGDIDSPNSVPNVYGTPQGVMNDVIIFPFNDSERTIAILDRHKDEIACIIIDPIPHRIGMMRASSEYIETLYNWTRKNDSLLAFDEVICFRVNYDGAQSFFDVKPDLTSLGKMIGGGFPIGAFAGRRDVMSVLDPRTGNARFPLSGTFSANPISLTAGKTALELFNKDAVLKLNNLTQIAKKQIQEAAAVADIPLSILGEGSMFRLHFLEKPPGSYRESFSDDKMKKINTMFLDHLYEKKVILVNSCSCMLSTIMSQTEIDFLTEAMLSAFKHIKPNLDSKDKGNK
ncbi:MAG: aspartate aminotransferase family protein [Ignavibacteria bacterium]|nr:aspartate aminotransferase family protein [Ignavibacteria bacterium]